MLFGCAYTAPSMFLVCPFLPTSALRIFLLNLNKNIINTYLRRVEMRKAILVITMSAGLCIPVLAGTAGNALYFDGGDYAHAPYISTYNLPVFTVEAWVKPVSTGGSIVSRGEDFTNDHSALNLGFNPAGDPWGEGVGMWYENNSNIDYAYASGQLLAANVWAHIAATRSSDGKVSIYVNGALSKQWTSTGIPASNCLQELDFGAFWNDSGNPYLSFYTGVIDEVRLWNVARMPTEMAQYYNKPVNPAEAGLIGYWNFDEGAGVIAHDLTGLNNAALGLDGTDVPTWIVSSAPIIPEPATIALLGIGAVLLRRSRR